MYRRPSLAPAPADRARSHASSSSSITDDWECLPSPFELTRSRPNIDEIYSPPKVHHAQHIKLDPPEDPFGIRTFRSFSQSCSSSDAGHMPDDVGGPAELLASPSESCDGNATAASGWPVGCHADDGTGADASEQRPARCLLVVLCAALTATLVGLGMDVYLAILRVPPARSVMSVYEQHRMQRLTQIGSSYDLKHRALELHLHGLESFHSGAIRCAGLCRQY
jgi:hypothetical protein